MTNEEAKEILEWELNSFKYTDNEFVEATKVAIKALEERPQGEWEYTDGRWGLGDWRCSKCGGYTNKDTHYCPNCGARME